MAEATANDFESLRAVAGHRVRNDILARWWCKKYNRPRKDPLLQEYTPEELIIEYLEDLIDANPAEEFPRSARESGGFIYRTGDALIDKWQEAAATGERINFGEAFGDDASREQYEKIKAESRRRYQERTGAPPAEDIHDDYTKKDGHLWPTT